MEEELPEEEAVAAKVGLEGLVVLIEPEFADLDPDTAVLAVGTELSDPLIAEAVAESLVTASSILLLAAFGTDEVEREGLLGVVLGSLGGVGSREPSMFLYQLLLGSSKQSPTVTALNPFEAIDCSIISVILFTVSGEVSWPITSILSELGSDLAVRLPEKSFIDTCRFSGVIESSKSTSKLIIW